MDDINFLDEELLRLPINYDNKEGFRDSTSKLLSDYIKLLKKYKYNDKTIKMVTSFRNYYIQMIDCYYKGQHSKAYQKFKTSLKHLNINEGLFIIPLKEKEYYRARICNNTRGFDLDEMWHIPFDKRGIVKTERFSFPGLPCLYFGDSAYSCWIELNRPEFSMFQVARASINENNVSDAMVFDIGLVPSTVKRMIKEGEKINIDEYVLLWPVIAMSMVQVCDENAVFKPEYIFPQFLMEYVSSGEMKEKNIIGIRYASTKVTHMMQYTTACRTYICYVFPTSSTKDKNVKDVKTGQYFRLEDTISGINQNVLSYRFSRKTSPIFDDFARRFENDLIYVDEHFSTSYDETRFNEIEFFLNAQGVLDKLGK